MSLSRYIAGVPRSLNGPRAGLMKLKSRESRVMSVCLSTEGGVETEKKKLKISPEPPVGAKADMIGPPDPTSNIPPIRFYIPPNETATERDFRLRRKEVLEWNQEFWSKHNTKFFKEKELFIRQNMKQPMEGKKKKSLTPEEMSVFYRSFLNENRNSHFQYNKEWYKKNFSLLWPALKVTLIRWRRKVSGNAE
ncbi:COA8 family protein CBG23705, mitochondrial [Aplysia californica]|uniref:COA8 family protein CBG23705, mitochondrial n=1 Tax=Aplysia californica TaxID=6500 RepID=A0ABM0JUD7_APLCA|nr:COA8 family protein CBG23705, mitochondrial [Aplysia californica]